MWKNTHFQGSLIKSAWNSRHSLLQTTSFQGWTQKVARKSRGDQLIHSGIPESCGGKCISKGHWLKTIGIPGIPFYKPGLFQGFWQKITWKIRGVGEFTTCVLNRVCTDKKCNKSFAMANCILHFCNTPVLPTPLLILLLDVTGQT